MKTYKGMLHNFFETGCEGMMWVLIQDNMKGYEALVDINEGDYLKIFNEDGSVIFDGVIKEDHEIGYAKYPLNPEYGQPAALGYWIHWTQSGWQPDDWARLFFHSPPLRAELTRK
jgi:hypothetical protein